MDPNNEIAQYREEQTRDACIQADDCAPGGHPLSWVLLAAIVVVLLISGRTVRLIILGFLAIPLIGLVVVMGVPFVIMHVLGDALSVGQRGLVSLGAVAGIIWLAFRWLDRPRMRDSEKPPN